MLPDFFPRRFFGILLFFVVAVAVARFVFESKNPCTVNLLRSQRHIATAEKPHGPNQFNISSSVIVIGSDYSGEKDDVMASRSVELVLVLPHKLEYDLKTKGVGGLSSTDYRSVQQLAKFLYDNQEFDAAAGVVQAKSHSTPQALLLSSACRYVVKNWTMMILLTGPMPVIVSHDLAATEPLYLQRCNFAETAFLIRKSRFESIGWRPEFGRTSLLDFFLRSMGRVNLAKVAHVKFSNALNRVDRGKLEMKMEFTDYSEFGHRHDILRIVYSDRIEWTKCADNSDLCPEKSFPSRTNVRSDDRMPICCSVVMDDLLVALSDALRELGVDYRIAYGTLLGAVRSQTIIPHTDDVDIAIHRRDNDNLTLFAALQDLTGPRFNVVMKMRNELPVSNVLAHFTPTVFTDTAKYFQNENYIEGRALFSEEVLVQMKKLLPVENTVTERRFLDIYPSPEELFDTPASVVTINNRKYPGVKNVHQVLTKWYGEDYMSPNPSKHSTTALA